MNDASYYAKHPPRCLTRLHPRPVKLDDIVFDGHSDKSPNAVFRLVCPCGAADHFVLGFLHSEPDPFDVPDAFGAFMESPLALQCASCKRSAELIDLEHHGYDGEMGNGCNEDHEGRRSRLVCSSCGVERFQVFARFEYPPDQRKDADEEWRGKEQDLFSWFTLVVECKGCGHRGVVADEECA